MNETITKNNTTDENMIEKTLHTCTNCGRCKKVCLFLQKYNVNLKGFAQNQAIAKSCFLCNICSIACPHHLSGEKISLEHRQAQSKQFSFVPLLKNNYLFKNNSKLKSKQLLFLGCNYPSVYPKTCKALIQICKDMGIDYSIDCCKKPVYDMGKIPTVSNLEKIINLKGVKTLICTCPNCFYFLKKQLNIEVITIYEFLYKNKLGKKLENKIEIFTPCIDKKDRIIFNYLKYFLNDYSRPYEKIMCCGLGGGAKKHEPDIIDKIKNELVKINKNCGSIYSYCASCSIMFKKYGLNNIHNILSDILEVNEEPNYSFKNTLNGKLKNER